ncbi:MAG: alpha/beta fold hydrolase [Chloroflexi bacterium]|nr:alpha/beta fold hydrolase [Chloroflexota bacterium]
MPKVRVTGGQYFYEEKGAGTPVVFAHGLTFDHHMWDPQVEALSKRYRCLALDFLGHGASAGARSEYTLEGEAENLYTLMRQLGVEAAHVVGLSMGGMVGMRLALAHPQAVRSLVLLDTSAEPEVPDRAPLYEGMAQASRDQGPEAVVDSVLSFMFSQGFIQGQLEVVAGYKKRFLDVDREGIYWATLAITRRTDILDQVSRIRVPTLVIVGEEDIAVTPDKAEHIQERIAGSRLVRIPGSGHMTPIEQPERITELLSAFLASAEGAAAK